MRQTRSCLVCLVFAVWSAGCARPAPAPVAVKPSPPPTPPATTAPAGTYAPVAPDQAATPRRSVSQLFEPGDKGGELLRSAAGLTGPTKIVDTRCVWVAVPGRTDRVIEVHIPRKGDAKHPSAMFLRLATLVRTPIGYVLPTPGAPYVVCRLNAVQAADVMANDLPPELLTTMDGAADGAGWRPMPDGIAAYPGEIIVNPSGFFESKKTGTP
ncbi:MAG: hypothetical protein QM783_15385 [Phycisphaerales bacterium]